MSDENNKNSEETEEKQSPWISLLVGIIILAFAIYLFITLQQFENEGGEISLNWIIAIAYDIAGKWITSGILALIGLAITIGAIKELQEKRATQIK